MAVQISLPGQTIIVQIGVKRYTITFDDEYGIFIRGDTELEFKTESKTGTWLYVK